MNTILVPFLAAISYAGSILVAKYGLTRRRISLRDYIPGIFLSLAFFSFLTLIKWGGANSEALFKTHNLLLLIALIVTATIWNVLYYVGLSKEKMNTTEGVILLMPLMTIVFSWAVVPSNFDIRIAFAAAAATFLVAATYRPRKLVRFDIYGLMLMLAVVLMAIENVLAGELLQTNSISPATLYAIRTSVIFVIFYAYYRPSFRKLSYRTVALLAVSGFIGTSAMLLRFYGLRDAGITLTAIILILVPVIVFSSAMVFFHERMKPKR
ncbi:MAG TPA: EamA family transporter, partial [Candidatus Saccharimonadales bacterium]|nr:EamA family transporter [Candidatus Saccharimonadales bacterium]